jgi:SSS family solute:Na+ symporter
LTDKTLNSFQIAALLVSASCGVGFLFGSGELALKWSMAGSIYALATAVGMLILAVFARRVWSMGGPIWDVLRQDYGETVARWTAFLSVVWMLGVLAAQIIGGSAILTLLGVSSLPAFCLTTLAIFLVSQVSLAKLSGAFAASLLASLTILVYSISLARGWHLYSDAVPLFVHDIGVLPAIDTIVAAMAIVFVVVTGADYHQFVLGARSSRDAVIGCAAAALFLLVAGFLPAVAVLSWEQGGLLSGLGTDAQAIPYIVSRTAGSIAAAATPVVLMLMLAAALGSGGALTRAAGSALATIMPNSKRRSRLFAALVLAPAFCVAAKGSGIVSSIVGLNVIFISSVFVLLLGRRRGMGYSSRSAQWIMLSGLIPSASVYLAGVLGYITAHASAYSLVSGLVASAVSWRLLRRSSLNMA